MATKQSTKNGLSAEEKLAIRERAKELKAEANRADGERMLLEKVAEMPPADRAMAQRIHEIVTAAAPELSPSTWYGMPAWKQDGKVVCFFKSADKFGERYATFGFDTAANLDDGSMWPTSFALTKLTAADEKRIAALVKQAVS